jgi:hypothetical protein
MVLPLGCVAPDGDRERVVVVGVLKGKTCTQLPAGTFTE